MRIFSIVAASIPSVMSAAGRYRGITKAVLLASCLSLSGLFAGVVTAAQPVDINQADAAALAEGLSGVGTVKAQAIVDYREANGPFTRIEQLTAVKGIGDKLVQANRQRIRVSSSAEAAAGDIAAQ